MKRGHTRCIFRPGSLKKYTCISLFSPPAVNPCLHSIVFAGTRINITSSPPTFANKLMANASPISVFPTGDVTTACLGKKSGQKLWNARVMISSFLPPSEADQVRAIVAVSGQQQRGLCGVGTETWLHCKSTDSSVTSIRPIAASTERHSPAGVLLMTRSKRNQPVAAVHEMEEVARPGGSAAL